MIRDHRRAERVGAGVVAAPLVAPRRSARGPVPVWHGVRDMIDEAERLGDSELVHFLAVAQLLIEERATSADLGRRGLRPGRYQSLPN